MITNDNGGSAMCVEQRKQRNKNAMLSTMYSSIRVVVAFVEQTIILQALDDLVGAWFYLIAGVISFGIAFTVCNILIKQARKWIETQKDYPDTINNKVVDIATLLGYFSMGLCVIELISGIVEKFEMMTPAIFRWKWGFVMVITVCSFLIPLVFKKNNE